MCNKTILYYIVSLTVIKRKKGKTKVKEFFPWSTKVYQNSIKNYLNGQFSILDIQLNGKCNYNCIYCDSPDRNLSSKIDFEHLENLILHQNGLYEWMFICGLGEPLWKENKDVLLHLLALCKRKKMKCTIFTNGSNIDDCIIEYVRSGILFPLIKIDSFSSELAESLYGTSQAAKNLLAIQELFKVAKEFDDEYYHIAASIVPTSQNLQEIPSIVECCIKNNTFPLLGQLEYAGKAIGSYNDLLLSKNTLLKLKNQISKICETEYKVPICPSVIAGIHINNDGYVSVDSKSGLSCSWFWLETPQTTNLCEINTITSLTNAEKAILNYRKKTFDLLPIICFNTEQYPFGGCGGNIKDLLADYIKIQNKLFAEL